MTDSPTIFLAFAAGLVSFLSPCTLPLVPAYIAAIGGGDGTASASRRIDRRLLWRSGLFVLTFSTIFIALGLTATALGSFLIESQFTLRKIAGVVIGVMGVLLVASLFVLRLNRDWRPSGLSQRAGNGGPIVAGAAFAIAWTPCVGPTLGAILGLASTNDSALRGAALLAVYSAGLAVPFLACTFGVGRLQRGFPWFRRHATGLQAAAGVVLVVMGWLVYTNELFRLNIEAQKFLDQFGLNFFQYI